jgi:hypothetical protein
MKTTAISMAATLVLMVLALIAALALGGPKPIAPLAIINAPFAKDDFSDVPTARHFAARDGTRLAWLSMPAIIDAAGK